MKLYFHFGFARAGTKTLQFNLFPKHSQINYLGRYPRVKPRLELMDLIINLNNDDFDKRYSELLKKAEKLYLDPNKTNVISYEYIILNSILYPYWLPVQYGNDNFRTVSRTLSRINSLFSKIHVDAYFFCLIRSQSKIIRSLYSITSAELNGSITFTGEEIIQYFKTKNTNKPMMKRLLDGFNYWELYKNLSKIVGENKIKFFLFEELEDNLDNIVSDLSNYLKIDPAISIKLLKYKREHQSADRMKENLVINSPLSAVCSKLIKNFKNPINIFINFDKKLLKMFKLLYIYVTKYKQKEKEISKIRKENLIKQLNIINNNSSLIKKYYRNDCLELKNKLKLDIDKYDYL